MKKQYRRLRVCPNYLKTYRLEEAIESLERGKDECKGEDWELFPPDDLEGIIENLTQIISNLKQKIGDTD